MRAGYFALYFLALLLFALGAAPMTDPPAWIRQHARPFATTEPRADHSDLETLRSIVGSAHIVGLGECTHGTRECFQMKHRITEFLATEMGFHLFAIEANMPEAYRVNDYVLTGRGDPRALIRGMYFWTWQTEEVLAMVEWMRTFNASGRGQIQFLGFDMQMPDTAAAIVRRFVERSEPTYLAALDSAWSQVHRARATHLKIASVSARDTTAPPMDFWAAFEAAHHVVDHLEGNRATLASAATPTELDWATQNARVVEQAMSIYCTSESAGMSVRDSCMARNVEWILAHAAKGDRIVLWAHNWHVSRRASRMGDHLARRHGADYRVIGFATARGTYRATGTSLSGDNVLLPAPSGSLEEALSRAGPPRYLIDVRAQDPAARDWFEDERPMRSIGALATSNQFWPARVGKEFDAIVWVDSTSAAVPMKGR